MVLQAVTYYYIFFFLLVRLPPRSTLFPYTTLFRSVFAERDLVPARGIALDLAALALAELHSFWHRCHRTPRSICNLRFRLATSASGATAAGAHFRVLNLFAVESSIDPALHADRPVRRERRREPVIHVRLERRQRDRPHDHLLGAGDFGTAEPPGDHDLDPLRARLHRRLRPLLEHAAEAGALLELLGDRLGDELSVQVRVLDLDDLPRRHLAPHHVLDLLAELVHLRALRADDQAR